MKIVFMGSPEFAIPSIEKILSSEHKIELIVSAPDKERGRGKLLSPTPVKEFALKNGIEVLTPESLKETEFIERLKLTDADLFVVVAFRILPREVFTIPRKGAFNLHGSLLPKYRGAAPIQWSLINGDKETGVTTFFLDDKVDTGKIILREKLTVDDEDDFGSLHNKMMILGADAVMKTIDLIDGDSVVPIRQDDSLALPAPKITKETCVINLDNDVTAIHNLIRGLSPFPGAFFELDGKKYKVYKTKLITEIQETESINSPGLETIKTGIQGVEFLQGKSELYLKNQHGILKILEIQSEGRKRMTVEEFLRGYSLIKENR